MDVKVTAVTAAIMDVCRTAMEMHGLDNLPVNERSLRMKSPKSYQELGKVCVSVCVCGKEGRWEAGLIRVLRSRLGPVIYHRPPTHPPTYQIDRYTTSLSTFHPGIQGG